jgi:peptidoglycan/xylan/chitin deacetylase (PgdA/CDA1 family)
MYRRALVAVLVLALVGPAAGCARKAPSQPGASATPGATASATATSAPTPSSSPGRSPTSPPAPTTAAPTPTRATAPPTGLPARLRGKDFEAIPTSRKVVALTFDAGSTDAGLRTILATLSSNGVTGTFFVTGAFADRYPAAIRAIVAGGHRLGNHSYTHPYFTKKTDSQIATELARAEAAIRANGGTSTVPLFRFPYGDRNTRTIAAVNASGYTCVRWTVDTLGWKGTVKGGITAQTVIDRVLAGAKAGAIVMMHVGANPDDGTTLDADALPTVITQLKARGYSFATLDVLVAG